MNRSPDNSNNRILIIDDNPAIHGDIRKILSSAETKNPLLEEAKAAVFGEAIVAPQGTSFEIDSAFQGEEGLDKVRRALENGKPYALAFVDMRMPPGWDGVTTITHLWKASPDLQIVICTAYADHPWEEIVEKLGKSAKLVILKKPFDNIEVLQLSHALAEKWNLNEQVRARLANLDRLVHERTTELESANKQLRHEIAERNIIEQALRQAQKMEAVGQLAAGVAHDFNNILTVILGQVSILADIERSPESDEAIREIRDSAERAVSLVRQLLAFSRKQVIQPVPLDLGKVTTNLGDVLRRLLGEHIRLEVKRETSLPLIEADLRMIEQVVFNLSVNARDAMPRGGSLTIHAYSTEVPEGAERKNPEARPGRYVCLSVSDTGCGMDTEVLQRIFEPFFTTKETGKGTGLGLASVYGIVKQHTGWIDVHSEVDQGTTFKLYLPVCANTPAEPEKEVTATPLPGGHETILVVEDEPSLRTLTVRILERNGYKVFNAESGVKALEIFREHADKIDLLLTDMVMPGGVLGQDLALRLREQKPSLKIICMTGYSKSFAGMDIEPAMDFKLLPKPFTTNDLLRNVRQVLG